MCNLENCEAMKVGILTFHCPSNYGAVLQAYGLQMVLQKMGHDTYIIDYKPEFLIRPYRSIRKRSPEQWSRLALHPRTFCHEILCMLKRSRRNRAFSEFRQRRLNLLIPAESKNMDVLVVGSDQVWNIEMTGGDMSYFLPDAYVNQLKITYAASAGQCGSLEASFVEQIINLIADFDAVSVREASLAAFLKDKLNLDTPVVLDPVLLAGKDVFERFVDSKYIPKEKYLLSFSLALSENQECLANMLARQMGISKVVTLVGMTEYNENHDRICTAKVEQFVSLVAGASYVVTSSFHGTAFSILFERQFITVGRDENHASRMKSLLDKLDLSSNLIYEKKLDKTDEINLQSELCCKAIDYTAVNKILSKERTISVKFLQSSLFRSLNDEEKKRDIIIE